VNRLLIALFTVLVVIVTSQRAWNPRGDLSPMMLSAILAAAALLALVIILTINMRRLRWFVNHPRAARVVRMGCFGVIAAATIESFARLMDQHVDVLAIAILLPVGFMAIQSSYLLVRWYRRNKES